MTSDPSTRERLQARIKLRAEVFVWPETYGGTTWYHLELTERGRFFRVGISEYTFLSLLDGETSLAGAISLTARVLGPEALTEEQALSLVKWLTEAEIVESRDDISRTAETQPHAPLGKLAEKLNPFWMKVPIINPDRIIERLLPWLGWMHSLPAMLLAVVMWIVAVNCMFGRWSEFTASSQSVLAPSNWLYLTVAWIVLKVAHETSHAIACRRAGGSVRETGLIFILLAPVAYVDVTSSLRFRSKWQRIQTAAAGMFIELTIAALAMFVWCQSSSPELKHVLFNVIFMASLTTLLFNANPLMRFDGYYILSDVLEIPNLASTSQQACQTAFRRWCLGLPTPPLRETGPRARLILLYGLAAWVWRGAVCISLTIAASVLWHGLGVVLAVGCWLAWLGRPLLLVAKTATHMQVANPRLFRRAALRVSGLTAIVAALLIVAPWPLPRSAPGFVEYRNLAVIRAESPGFIASIEVADGEVVEAGQLLITLENHELATDVDDLRAAYEQSEIRRDQAIGEQNTAAVQIEDENLAAISKRLTEKQRQFTALSVRAPMAGRVMSRTLKWRLGTYATEGSELVTIGDESQKEFRASLTQTDADALRSSPSVALHLPSVGRFAADARRVIPKASFTPPHAALTSVNGGPLAVREIPAERQNGTDQFEFTEPRLTADFPLDGSHAALIPVGKTGHITLAAQAHGSLGAGLFWTIRDQIDRQLKVALRDQLSDSPKRNGTRQR